MHLSDDENNQPTRPTRSATKRNDRLRWIDYNDSEQEHDEVESSPKPTSSRNISSSSRRTPAAAVQQVIIIIKGYFKEKHTFTIVSSILG